METIHNHVSAAKAIKRILAEKWPSVHFSVVSDSFANGNSIDIYWSFGPTTEQVERIANRYEVGSFDGMTDCYNYDPTIVLTNDNQLKEMGGAKYVMTKRSYKSALVSEQEFKERFCRDLCALQGVEYQGEDTNIFGKEWNYDQTASRYFWRVFCQTDFTDKIYDGVEFNHDDRAPECFKIKTRPITSDDLQAEEKALNEKKIIADQEKAKEENQKNKVKQEIREYFIKAMTENPEKVHSSLGFTNWYKAQMAGRILSQLEKEKFCKLAYISTTGKKCYKKEVSNG